jgi:hypothetical protein
VQVLAVGDAGIAHIVSFIQPELFPVFGLPQVLPAPPANDTPANTATATARPRR